MGAKTACEIVMRNDQNLITIIDTMYILGNTLYRLLAFCVTLLGEIDNNDNDIPIVSMDLRTYHCLVQPYK